MLIISHLPCNSFKLADKTTDMIQRILPILLLTTISFSVKAQETIPLDSIFQDTTYWTAKSLFGLNGTQTSFVNWAAGGRNNFSALAFIDATATYQKEKIKWSNDFKFALGGLQFLDREGRSSGLQKTDDRIDIATSVGYEFRENWFYSAVGGFRTQMLNGFSYPNDSVRVSKFMAPGYVNFALGIEYAPSENFNMFLSPIAAKFTFVNDDVLANEGAFGVNAATYDGAGNLISAGQKLRKEFGAYFKLQFNKEIFTNIEMKSRLELFSNYVENPQNVDVNAETVFTFKVNQWFSASLQWNLIYDDDMKINTASGAYGPRTQFKSVLGLGISYTLKNQNVK